MARATTEQQVLENIAAARRVLENAERDLKAIRDAKQLPKAPDSSYGNRFTMTVRFPGNSKQYEFLLIRVNGIWYTTGTTRDSMVFASWQALVKWVRSETVDGVYLRPLELMRNESGKGGFSGYVEPVKLSK